MRARVCFSKLEGESEVWGIKKGDTIVVVDDENLKIEGKGCSGEGDKPSGCETVWNDVGGNRTGLSLMNEDPRNREEDVDEELRE